jgi:hypothetical protein
MLGHQWGHRWPKSGTTPATDGYIATARDSWKRLLKRAGLPDYKFHELRHATASLALAEGASLFHVSRMLGHSSISITADTYGHWTDEGRQDVAARLERALLGDLESTLAVTSPGALATTMATNGTAKRLLTADSEIETVAEGVSGGT